MSLRQRQQQIGLLLRGLRRLRFEPRHEILRLKRLLIFTSVRVDDSGRDHSSTQPCAVLAEWLDLFEDHPLVELLELYPLREFIPRTFEMPGQTKRKANVWPGF